MRLNKIEVKASSSSSFLDLRTFCLYRNTVQFTLELEDVNDNAPVYIQSHLEIYINENESSFPYRFRVEAFDHDLNGIFFSFIQVPLCI